MAQQGRASHDERVAEEARLEYLKINDFIKDLKRQQWSVAYYALALYAAIVGLHQILSKSTENGPTEQYMLMSFVFLTLALAIYLTIKNINSLTTARRHVIHLRNEFFSAEVRRNLDFIHRPKESYEKWWYDLPILIPFGIILLVGAGVVLWLIIWRV